MLCFARWLDPIGKILGMNGLLLVAFLLSFPANELLLPVMALALCSNYAGAQMADSGLLLLQAGITPGMALCAGIFTIFHWPCGTTVLTVQKETGKWRYGIAAILLPTGMGMLLCALVNLLLRFL